MVIPQTGHYLSIDKVGKKDQILCVHLDPFRWPSHISAIVVYVSKAYMHSIFSVPAAGMKNNHTTVSMV